MTDSTIGRIPAMKAVWMEQLRVVGLAIRREAGLAALVVALGSVAVIGISRLPVLQAIFNEDMQRLVFDPAESPWMFIPVLAALLLPIVVWKGERRFGDTPLWSMPVDHRRHILLKVTAGWVWLMAILAAFLAWATLTTMVSGGALGVDEVRLLLLDAAGASAGAPDAMEPVNWTTPWWQWVLPFTSASAAYLLASTLVLATARPLFWAAGLWVAGAVVLGIGEIWDIGWMQRTTEFVAWYIGGESFARGVQLPTGREVVWTLLPTVQMWMALSAFWITLGLAGVLVASGRPRNQ
ncbi:MAG: hypothetical protein F4106_12015 [Gemmatimonadetes bacterium]|nr:hypothetical protein [Gemmatimonadota bacterium]MXX72644.1 hypothetical protein [Gemmatimonadota bacterium]MYC90300.1 hypothetical protein [Gemmatimonadota bacterium]MYG36212.1 hypothetical protein [Gemmatimonadota bacterium]MYJ18739.1 hypothetical protein [Gemmatimonadota bacterium]